MAEDFRRTSICADVDAPRAQSVSSPIARFAAWSSNISPAFILSPLLLLIFRVVMVYSLSLTCLHVCPFLFSWCCRIRLARCTMNLPVHASIVSLLFLVLVISQVSAVLPPGSIVTPREAPVLNKTKELPPEQALIRSLLKNYEPHGRPVSDPGRPIIVLANFGLTQIQTLDERLEILSTIGWFQMEWFDELLIWNSTGYKGIDFVNLPAKRIWSPDITIKNSVNKIIDMSWKEIPLTIYSNGKVFWYTGGTYNTKCALRIFYYPFDRQRCSLVIQQWNHPVGTVIMTNRSSSITLSDYSGSGEWMLLHATSWVRNHSYEDDITGQVYSEVYFDMYVRRKQVYYIINILYPCFLLAILDLMVFFLPPAAGEKISLGTTVLLAFTVFQLLIAENMPKTSDTTPIIVIYLTFFMTMTTLSVILSVIVLRMHHCSSDYNFLKRGTMRQLLTSLDAYEPALERTNPEGPGLDADSAQCNGSAPLGGSRSHATRRDWQLNWLRANCLSRRERRQRLVGEIRRGRNNLHPLPDFSESHLPNGLMTTSFGCSPGDPWVTASSAQDPAGLGNTEATGSVFGFTAPPLASNMTYREASATCPSFMTFQRVNWPRLAEVCDRLFLIIYIVVTLSTTMIILYILPATAKDLEITHDALFGSNIHRHEDK